MNETFRALNMKFSANLNSNLGYNFVLQWLNEQKLLKVLNLLEILTSPNRRIFHHVRCHV